MLRETFSAHRLRRVVIASVLALGLGVSVVQAPQTAQAATATCSQVLQSAQTELTNAQAALTAAKKEQSVAQTAKTTADKNLTTAKNELTAAQNELTAAKNTTQYKNAQTKLTNANTKLTQANSAFASVKAEKAKIDTVNSQANSAAGVLNDVVFSGQTPLYVQVNGNTGKPANSTLVAVEGTYVNGDSDGWTQTKILEYINKVRQEAYKEGLVDKYVPLTWSKYLERTAQVRAAEVSIYGDHTRPSGESWYGVSDEGMMPGGGENLSWGGSYYTNVKMWVDEKEDYKKYLNCSKGKKTVNGVNQCDYGTYGHYRTLVKPEHTKIGIAQFNSDRKTVNPYTTAMAAEFNNIATSSQSADLKPLNKTVYQGVYIKTSARGTIGTAGATTFDPTAVTGDPVWTRKAQVKEVKALAKSMASAEWTRIQSNYNTKQAAVTAAQKEVTSAQSALNAVTATQQTKVNTAQTKVNNAQTTATNAQTRLTKANTAVTNAQKAVTAAQTKVNNAKVCTDWTRLAGAGSLDTMSAVVSRGFTQTGGTVVVATNNGYHDAVSASAIAGLYSAPILLTDGKTLSAQTKAQLQRLKPKQVIISGGAAVVTNTVATAIKSVTGVTPTRYWGSDASGTADALAKAGKGKWGTTAIVVSDAGYNDPLSIAPYAYAKHTPIFYAAKGKTLSAATLSTMQTLGIKSVYIVGGTLAVTTNVDNQLKAKNITVAKRLAGTTAIDTSRAVAQFAISQGMTANNMGIATTSSYTDGLVGAAFCGKNNAVLVLTNGKDLSAIDAIYKANKAKVKNGYVFGGTAVIPDSVITHLKQL